MITLENVTLLRNDTPVLQDISMRIAAQGITAVVGANGAGKSSFLRLLHGLEPAHIGRIHWQPPIMRQDQSFVFQKPIFLRRSVAQNLYFPLSLRAMPKKQAQDRVKQALSDMQLIPKAALPAQLLSGGEQQKLALARALITSPKLLFLDEPSANLDENATALIERHILRAYASGARVFLASHIAKQIERLATDIIVMEHGTARGPFKP